MLTFRPFDLPTPPGAPPPTREALTGAPPPEIGQIVSATSTIDAQGLSTNPEFGPMGTGRRIAITLLLAIVIFGVSFLGMMFATGGNGSLAGILALPLTAAGCWLSWTKMGTTRREGTIMYIGSHGVQVIEIKKDVLSAKQIVYLDADVVVSEHKDVIINGSYAYSLECVRFLDRNLEHRLAVVGTYDHPDRPSDEAFAAREVGRLARVQRAAAARAKLAAGETIVFPVLEQSGFKLAATSKHLSLQGSQLVVHVGRGQPQMWELGTLSTRVVRGNLELVRRDNGHVIETFELHMFGNSDVLLALTAAPVAHQRVAPAPIMASAAYG